MCLQSHIFDIPSYSIHSQTFRSNLLSPPTNKPKETSSSTEFSRSSSTSNFAQGNTDKNQPTWLALYALNLSGLAHDLPKSVEILLPYFIQTN